MLTPISLREARQFVAAHHRHNAPTIGWLFGTSLREGDEVRAVAIAGRPLARSLQDGRTVEITRVCTLGDRNAASRLYGALCRAAKALGYQRAVTYTLASESGSSLRAAGFGDPVELAARESWASRHRPRYDESVWGETALPDEPRVRWTKPL